MKEKIEKGPIKKQRKGPFLNGPFFISYYIFQNFNLFLKF